MTTTTPVVGSVEPVVPRSTPWRSLGMARLFLRPMIARPCPVEPVHTDPTTRAQEAHATREYALQFFRTDPRLAADLCAAADRHESGGHA